MAWVATVSLMGVDYGNINTTNIIRVSQIIAVTTTDGVTMTGGRNTKYYFKVVMNGETIKSEYYDTDAEALLKQVAAESAYNV